MVQLFGDLEPVTLSYAAYSRPITAIVNDLYIPGSPIDGIPARDEHNIVCKTADAAGVNPEWTVAAKGITRPVVSTIPDDGLTIIVLGSEI